MTLEQYLERFTPVQRGKIAKALDRYQRFNGQVMKRSQWAEQVSQRPRLRFDESAQRLYFINEDNWEVFLTPADVTMTAIDYALALANESHR